MSPEPYYSDSMVTLYHGDMREVLPRIGVTADACLTDPPYGETSLTWDRWPDGWPALVAGHTSSLWCFGSIRMFLDKRDDFAGWRLAQDVVGEFVVDTMVWEKGNGSGPTTADRFRRVHELATHWYRGLWRDIYHEAPRIPGPGTAISHSKTGSTVQRLANDGAQHRGAYSTDTLWFNDGTRQARSVVFAKSMRGKAIHPTEKPSQVIAPLIEHSVPPDGIVLDPFAGSASTLLTARSLGRRAIGIEANESYCEKAATRLAEPDLFGDLLASPS